MSDRVASALERVRQPEYTGENRCLPCTIVNVAIAAVLAGALAIVAPVAGLVAFVAFLLLIYLRGYLVPGTPALTKRYLPDRILAAFDQHPAPSTADLAGKGSAVRETASADASAAGTDASTDAAAAGADSDVTEPDAEETPAEEPGTDEVSTDDDETWESVKRWKRQRENAVDPERFLLETGAVGPCPNAGDLCLTDAFAARIDHELEPYRSEDGDGPVPDRETIAATFDVDPEAVSAEDRDYPAYAIDRRIRTWPHEAALVADVATDRAFRDLTDRWTDVPLKQRLGILESLRSFHEECPRCGGEIEASDETVDSCCRAIEVVALDCRRCGGRLLELEPELAGA